MEAGPVAVVELTATHFSHGSSILNNALRSHARTCWCAGSAVIRTTLCIGQLTSCKFRVLVPVWSMRLLLSTVS